MIEVGAKTVGAEAVATPEFEVHPESFDTWLKVVMAGTGEFEVWLALLMPVGAEAPVAAAKYPEIVVVPGDKETGYGEHPLMLQEVIVTTVPNGQYVT